MGEELSESKLHMVMFPWFAFGHISPFVQLSNRLCLHPDVKVSFFSAPGNIPRIRSSLKLSPLVEIIPLEIPRIDGLPPGLDSTSEMTAPMAELLKQALDLMRPQIEELLSRLKPHFVFFDFAHYWMPSVGSHLGIKTVQFSVFAAISGAYLMVPARADCQSLEGLMKPPKGFPATSLTSIKEFVAQDYTYVFKSFHGNPSVYDRNVNYNSACDALVLKTSSEMEGPYVDYKRTQYKKPVLLAGPLVNLDPPAGELEEKWANWLGNFPAKSVIYCSFGSETFLDDEQIKELAMGLEQTGLPFLLVLNFPANVDAESEVARTLPEGFVERVKNRGVVHTGWMQQQLILAHQNVGCFVCHSGFSSVTEALVNDCQLVLLPLKADQFLNSRLVAGDLRAGVEVNRRDSDGYFGKEDIYEAVKTVMVDVDTVPGVSIRANHKYWREFLLNGQIQATYIANLVKELKALA